MKIKIYGKPSCPYCEKAKSLASSFGTYEYIDIISSGIDKEKLSDICGKEVTSVPQIFVDDVLVGGYTEFASKYGQNL